MHPFRAAVEARDLEALTSILHPDVVFKSPAVFRPYEGRDAVTWVLAAAIRVFEDFHYVDELVGDGTHALVFRAKVGDRTLEGVDHLTIVDGLVTELTVFVRPRSGLDALAARMAELIGG